MIFNKLFFIGIIIVSAISHCFAQASDEEMISKEGLCFLDEMNKYQQLYEKIENFDEQERQEIEFSAKAGDVDSMITLAVIAFENNENEIFVQWAQQAKQHDSLYASFLLWDYNARDTNPLDIAALQEVENIARQGYILAQLMLTSLYYQGAGGFPKDHKKAIYFAHLTTEFGCKDVSAMLGEAYLSGLGVLQSNINAYKWYLIASTIKDEFYFYFFKTNENKTADSILELKNQMTDGEISAAKSAAQQWLDKHGYSSDLN